MTVGGAGMAVRGAGMAVRGAGMAVRGAGMAVRGAGMAVRGAGVAVGGWSEGWIAKMPGYASSAVITPSSCNAVRRAGVMRLDRSSCGLAGTDAATRM